MQTKIHIRANNTPSSRRKVSISNFDPEPAIMTEVSVGFPQFLVASARTVLQMGHGRYLPYPLQFI
jgi:hypothetical protein